MQVLIKREMKLLHHQIDSHSVNDALFDKPNMIY